jgi:uncharacterized membrane protein
MSYNTYRKWQAVSGMVIGGVTGASVAMDNWIVPVVTIIICISIMTFLRRRVKEIVADERTFAVAGKAARLTMLIGIFGMVIIGAIFIFVGRDSAPELTQLGFTLVYAACAFLVINYIAYYYYNNKLGGKP